MKTLKNKLQNVKQILKVSFSLGLLVAFIGCSPGTPNPAPAACSTTNTVFQQLYGTVVALPGHVNANTFDTEIHEYTFTFSQTKNICSIGYQSQPAIAATPYLIEVIDAGNNVVYSGNHVFSSANTSYVNVPAIPILANQPYTVRRTILLTNAGNQFANIIGRVVHQPGALVSFPQSFGIMTITGANFYQNGGPLLNRGIPYIDFGYY